MAYGSLQKRRLEGLASIQAAPAEAAQLAAYRAQLLQEASDTLLDAGKKPALHLCCRVQTLSQGHTLLDTGKKASATVHRPVLHVWLYMITMCQGLLKLLSYPHTSRPALCPCFHA